MNVNRTLLSLVSAIMVSIPWSLPADVAPNESLATPIASTNVHNLFRAATNIFSGDAPESEAAFAEIATLGVKTMISVDGIKPDIETARKFGLRYVHLPFGYDGVPTNRVAELTKVVLTQEGPIYVHCHHGIHRGPAAVAVICEATAGWTTNQAVAWLRQAGTSPDYPGLYRSAMDFRRPTAGTLARIGKLPEVAKTSSLIDAMVAIDGEFDRLKAAQKASWSTIPNQPALITPEHSATMLWEHFRELRRVDDTAKRPDDYRAKLATAEKSADQLGRILREKPSAVAESNAAMQAVGKSCAACHKQYRN